LQNVLQNTARVGHVWLSLSGLPLETAMLFLFPTQQPSNRENINEVSFYRRKRHRRRAHANNRHEHRGAHCKIENTRSVVKHIAQEEGCILVLATSQLDGCIGIRMGNATRTRKRLVEGNPLEECQHDVFCVGPH